MTPAEFRTYFPEFADTAKFPDARIQLYLTLAESQVTECVWGPNFKLGVALFTAHYLALGTTLYGRGGAGTVTGELSSKKVGDVQVSYATTSNRDESAGWWNSTGYGRQWWSLFRLLGVHVTQLI